MDESGSVLITTDPKDCWNCGERGHLLVGSKFICTACDVTWMPFAR